MPIGRLLSHGAAVLALFVLAMLSLAQPAAAQSCSLSISALAFGDVDVTANAQVDSTATATVTCTGPALATVGVCIDLGAGTGGGTSAANRFMVNGSEQLRYGLYVDASATTPWGLDLWVGGSPLGLDITLSAGGSGTVTRTIYGRVYGGQPTVAPLAYSSVLSGSSARLRYGLLSNLLGCNLLTVSQTASFPVTANVPATCRVTTADLVFGAFGTLSGQIDAGTTLAPTCTRGTSYQIGLDGGLSGATNPTLRRMTKGAESVTYGLYRNTARSQAFGKTLGSDTVAGTGTGLGQSVGVYGRVPVQPTPSPGLYSDTIVVTVTY